MTSPENALDLRKYVQRHETKVINVRDPATAGTTDPRAEIRKRIVRRLNTDEWMNRHFGISCHAGDVADAVLELFEVAEWEPVRMLPLEDFEGGPTAFAVRQDWLATHTRLVLRTVPEVKP